MNPDQIFIIVNDKRTSLAAFLAMDKAAVISVYASGCTALTSVDLPAAEYVDASGCTALTSGQVIDVGMNARGYDMSAIKLRGVWRIIAGCRNFNVEDARKHWGASSDRAHPEILAQVETIAAEIARREAAVGAEQAEPAASAA